MHCDQRCGVTLYCISQNNNIRKLLYLKFYFIFLILDIMDLYIKHIKSEAKSVQVTICGRSSVL